MGGRKGKGRRQKECRREEGSGRKREGGRQGGRKGRRKPRRHRRNLLVKQVWVNQGPLKNVRQDLVSSLQSSKEQAKGLAAEESVSGNRERRC